MKKLLLMLIILFSVYLSFQFAFKFFGKGHIINYQIKADDNIFDVEELYTLNRKDEINNYYFKVKVNDTVFSFQTYEDFGRSDMVLKKIRYFKNDQYECMLPIFRNEKIIFDVMCIQDNIITYYHDLKAKDKELDDFVLTIDETNYSPNKWQDNRNNMIEVEDTSIIVYPNNILDNHYVGVNNYRGIYTINNINLKKIVDVKIFNNDIYERKLSTMVGKFYITADYEADYKFTKFYIVDLTSNKVDGAISSSEISFDSYFQGVVKESLFIFDRANKKQYELNTKTHSVIEVGNANTGIKYYNNGTWERIQANDAAKNDILFKDNNNTSNDASFARIDKIGNALSGYYYYYKKESNSYKIYRANIQNKDVMTYLFSTNKIDNINYVYDYVYFTENNEVKYYNDKTGVKTLFRNEEFEFNKSLFYNIYLKY